MDMFTESVKKGCHHNHGYNYVNSWWICKILSMQNINILLFVRSLSLANLSSAVKQGGPVVRFPPGHYRQCNWPVEKVSTGMCSCKLWTFWTPFVNKLANNLHFSCAVGSSGFCPLCQIFCVDAWWSIDLPCLTVNEQKVKCWYFA